MGILSRIRDFMKGSNNAPVVQEDPYAKTKLATEIVNMVDKIKRINSFDSSIWNYNNITTYELQRRSLQELQQMHSTLNNRLTELYQQRQKPNPTRQSLEESKWTGQKPRNMTERDFDRFQREEDR